LSDLHAALTRGAPVGGDAATGKLILPDGCKNLDEAADQFLAGLAPEDLLAFEQALQKETSKKFKGIGGVAIKAAERQPAFRELLLTRSREFLDGKLDHSDPAALGAHARGADPPMASADHPAHARTDVPWQPPGAQPQPQPQQ